MDSFKILLTKAQDADTAFSTAIMEAGYKSRWDWDSTKDSRPYAAYITKVRADEEVHEAFESARRIDSAMKAILDR